MGKGDRERALHGCATRLGLGCHAKLRFPARAGAPPAPGTGCAAILCVTSEAKKGLIGTMMRFEDIGIPNLVMIQRYK